MLLLVFKGRPKGHQEPPGNGYACELLEKWHSCFLAEQFFGLNAKK